jgi:hypothetical protein
VLSTTSARFLQAPDYPIGVPEDALAGVRAVAELWGTEDYVRAFIPELAADDDFRRWYALPFAPARARAW